MEFPSIDFVLDLQRSIIDRSGGLHGVLDPGVIDSALAQPRQACFGQELYPTLHDKAAALCFFLVRNHGFVDGNKRIGHAAMEYFLLLNGWELVAEVGEQERVIIAVADGSLGLAQLCEWVEQHCAQTD